MPMQTQILMLSLSKDELASLVLRQAQDEESR